mmetsp:Transcript_16766/g.46844  ORF Transcript_16766/g.46844 Transcript_16766/m.46844 type:complete len:297 (-) Transcript_16766:2536-3426(-)
MQAGIDFDWQLLLLLCRGSVGRDCESRPGFGSASGCRRPRLLLLARHLLLGGSHLPRNGRGLLCAGGRAGLVQLEGCWRRDFGRYGALLLTAHTDHVQRGGLHYCRSASGNSGGLQLLPGKDGRPDWLQLHLRKVPGQLRQALAHGPASLGSRGQADPQRLLPGPDTGQHPAEDAHPRRRGFGMRGALAGGLLCGAAGLRPNDADLEGVQHARLLSSLGAVLQGREAYSPANRALRERGRVCGSSGSNGGHRVAHHRAAYLHVAAALQGLQGQGRGVVAPRGRRTPPPPPPLGAGL